MSIDIPYIDISPTFFHLIIIYSIYIFTWWKSVYGGWNIDDDMGLQQFSDKWRPESKDQKGETVPELLVDYYNQETGKDEKGQPIIKSLKNTCYNKWLGFPGAFMRWHRLQIGKKFQVIAKNKKGHDVYGWVQSPFRHHVWSILWHGLSLVLGYRFLSHQFGPEIAFPAILLFSIHPIISQCIAWISGINYLYCLTFLLLNYNILFLGLSHYWTIPLTILFTFLSSATLLVGCFNFAVLFILGFKWEALAALIIGLFVMFRDGKEVVSFRRREFKKQNMTSSITPNIRKPIVMLKTLWYYVCLITVPLHLGLYHEFGYHYDRKDEEPDSKFWFGLLFFIGSIYAFIQGDTLIRFCIVWFFSYFLIFSNFLTANQFVVERYIFIPSFAYCVIFGLLIYPFKELFWLLIGLYAMRSFSHIWTFKDQISFYSSNILNFPKSEVAYGNLGCAMQAKGMSGAAFDMWQEATKINPYYDVPWYNMHSIVKTAGQVEQAKVYLQKCMDAKVVHFKDNWEKDMQALDQVILKKQAIDAINKEMNEAINSGKPDLIHELKQKMDILMQPNTVVSVAPKQATT